MNAPSAVLIGVAIGLLLHFRGAGRWPVDFGTSYSVGPVRFRYAGRRMDAARCDIRVVEKRRLRSRTYWVATEDEGVTFADEDGRPVDMDSKVGKSVALAYECGF